MIAEMLTWKVVVGGVVIVVAWYPVGLFFIGQATAADFRDLGFLASRRFAETSRRGRQLAWFGPVCIVFSIAEGSLFMMPAIPGGKRHRELAEKYQSSRKHYID